MQRKRSCYAKLLGQKEIAFLDGKREGDREEGQLVEIGPSKSKGWIES